jgi:hypothetical protein
MCATGSTSCVLLAGLAFVATSAEPKRDPRMLERPVVTKPPCSNPKPYRIESWDQTMHNFRVVLAVPFDDVVLEAKRLSEKHKFEDGGIATIADGKYELWVDWLEPEQVAALRCESSVVEIGFVRLLAVH